MAAIDLIVLGMIKAQPQSAYELQKNVEYRNISKWVKSALRPFTKKLCKWRKKAISEGRPLKRERCRKRRFIRSQRQEKSFF